MQIVYAVFLCNSAGKFRVRNIRTYSAGSLWIFLSEFLFRFPFEFLSSTGSLLVRMLCRAKVFLRSIRPIITLTDLCATEKSDQLIVDFRPSFTSTASR